MAKRKPEAKVEAAASAPRARGAQARSALREQRFFFGGGNSLGGDNPLLARKIPITSAREGAAFVARVVEQSDVLMSIIKLTRRESIGDTAIAPRWASVQSDKWREKVSALWDAWAEQVTTDGQQSLLEFQGSLCETLPVDGVCLVDLKYHGDYNQQMALQAVPRQWIAEHFSDDARRVACGNEYARSGFMSAFWIYDGGLDMHKQARWRWGQGSTSFGGFPLSGRLQRIPSASACRLSIGGRIDDYARMPSPMLATVRALQQIAQADEATINAMMVAAIQVLIAEKGDNAEIAGDDARSEELKKREDDLWYHDVADGNDKMASGLLEMPIGYSAKSWTPASPSTPATEYRKAKLMTATAALGIDYATATGDLSSVNFSSLRHANLKTRNYYQEYQHCIGARLMRRVLRAWLMHHRFATGELAGVPERYYQQMMAVGFTKRRWAWIQPAEEIKRIVGALESGVMTPQQACGELGVEFSELLDGFADAGRAVQKMKDELGFTPSVWQREFKGAKGGGEKKDGAAEGEDGEDKDDKGGGDAKGGDGDNNSEDNNEMDD